MSNRQVMLRQQSQMLAGPPQLWFQPVVATPGLGPWALRTDRLARHLLAGFTTIPDSLQRGRGRCRYGPSR